LRFNFIRLQQAILVGVDALEKSHRNTHQQNGFVGQYIESEIARCNQVRNR